MDGVANILSATYLQLITSQISGLVNAFKAVGEMPFHFSQFLLCHCSSQFRLSLGMPCREDNPMVTWASGQGQIIAVSETHDACAEVSFAFSN